HHSRDRVSACSLFPQPGRYLLTSARPALTASLSFSIPDAKDWSSAIPQQRGFIMMHNKLNTASDPTPTTPTTPTTPATVTENGPFIPDLKDRGCLTRSCKTLIETSC